MVVILMIIIIMVMKIFFYYYNGDNNNNKAKGKIHKTSVRPAICLMETVGMTKKQENKIEVTEMRMMLGYSGKTGMDKTRNKVIRKVVRVKETREM